MQVTLPCKLSYELFVPRGCVLRNTLCAKGPTARYSLQHLNMIIKYIENDWYILNTTILLLLSICGHHCALQTSNTSKKNAALKRAQLGYLDLQVPAGPSYFLMTNNGQCRSTLHIVQHYPTHYNPPSRVAPWPLICNPRYVISVAAFTGPQTKTRLNAAEAVGKAGGCHAAREIVKWYGNHWRIYENIAQFCKCFNTT